MPRYPLLMMAMLTFRFSCTIVANSAHGHLEAAIAHHGPDFGFGTRGLHANRRRQRKSHRAEAAGSDQRARLFMLVILRFPHLVLSHVGDDDGVAAKRLPPKIVDHMRGVQMAVVGQILNIAHRGIALQPVDVAQPLVAVLRFQLRQQFAQHGFQIADQREVHFHVLVDLGAIDLDVDLFRVRAHTFSDCR